MTRYYVLLHGASQDVEIVQLAVTAASPEHALECATKRGYRYRSAAVYDAATDERVALYEEPPS